MNTAEKIKKSVWVILSFIPFLNGFGFAYIGLKHNNKNWLLEGVTYEVPWFFYFLVFAVFNAKSVSYADPTGMMITLSVILWLVSIIRSIWVAIKLCDVYDNNEKYTIRQTKLNTQRKPQQNNPNSDKFSCCICILCIFFIFALIAIL